VASYTLDENEVDLSNYESNPANARYMGTAHPDMLPSAGKYTFTAINHDQSEEEIGVYAFWPCVILDGDTRITWDGSTTPGTYCLATFAPEETATPTTLRSTTGPGHPAVPGVGMGDHLRNRCRHPHPAPAL